MKFSKNQYFVLAILAIIIGTAFVVLDSLRSGTPTIEGLGLLVTSLLGWFSQVKSKG